MRIRLAALRVSAQASAMTERERSASTLGVVLAGGASRRFGGDKPLRAILAGRPLVAHVAERLAAQGVDVAINANDRRDDYAALGYPVFDDGRGEDRDGPLAGLLAAITHARSHGYDAVLTAPADSPFLPLDLFARLSAAGGPAVAASGGRLHPVIGLWPVALGETLHSTFHLEKILRIATFVEHVNANIVEWSTSPIDPFMDVDHPQDLTVAQSHHDRLNGVAE